MRLNYWHFLFEKRDCYIGVFWDMKVWGYDNRNPRTFRSLDIYVMFLTIGLRFNFLDN